MDNVNNLTNEAILDLKHMLSDNEFKKLLLTDEGELASSIQINPDGSIILGKTKFKIINRLFNGEIKLSINDVCLKLIDALTGKGASRNRTAFEGLSGDFQKSLENKNYSYVISRIFVAYRLAYKRDLETNVVKKGEVADEKAYLLADGVMVKDGFGHVYMCKLK